MSGSQCHGDRSSILSGVEDHCAGRHALPDDMESFKQYVSDAHMFLHRLMLTLVSTYFVLSGTKATSVTLFSSSTKSTAASPLSNVASLG